MRIKTTNGSEEMILKAEDFRQAASKGDFRVALEKKRRSNGFGT